MPAFFSYAHFDDNTAEGKLVELANLLELEVRKQTGDWDFSVYIDLKQHEWGADWRRCIACGINAAAVFIPVLSPTYLRREGCQIEFDEFLSKQELVFADPRWDQRDRLILPLLYQEVRPEQKRDKRYAECDRCEFEDVGPLVRMGVELKSEKTGRVLQRLARRIVALHDSFEQTQRIDTADTHRSEIDALVKRLGNLAKPLLDANHRLPNGSFIERPELSDILEKLQSHVSCEVFLLGGPGSGKTAILGEISRRWQDEGHVLVLKGDILPVSINSLESLVQWMLGRDRNLESSLRRLTAEKPLLIVIDQLDSLANLVDLESGRLNAILDLISAVRTIPKVSVVAASRIAELKADQRLSALLDAGSSATDLQRKAYRIDLGLLPITDVLTHLSQDAIEAKAWPEDYLNFLAVPYHLALFLRHAKEIAFEGDLAPEESIFSSIRSIHHARWKSLAGGSDGAEKQVQILNKLASLIRDSEVLWQQQSDLTDNDHLVQLLCNANWLRRDRDHVAFDHQTQYEYVMAKNLAADVDCFVEYVDQRQHGLHVRPSVWHTLRFLREQSADDYICAISGILAIADRRHLKRLLIEFVCSVAKPNEQEIGWMSRWLRDPATNASACFLLRGHRLWFESLPDELLRELMVSGPHNSWPITRVLAAAAGFAPERVTRLIRDQWAFREPRFANLWAVVSGIDSPKAECANWLHWIIENHELEDWKRDSLSQDWKEHSPRQVIRLTAAYLHRFVDRQTVEEEIELPRQEKTYLRRHGIFTEFADVFDKGQNDEVWREAVELAEKEPEYFLETVWPWLVRVLTNHSECHRSRLREFRHESVSYRLFPSKYPLSDGEPTLLAIENALQHLSKTNPDTFIAFVIANLQVDSLVVQRVLLRAVRRVAKQIPDLTLAMLKQDERRLKIESDPNAPSETETLVRAVMPYWNESQLHDFQNLVCDWNPYRDDEEPNYALAYRAELLRWVPVPCRNGRTLAALAANERFQKDLEEKWESRAKDQPREEPRRLSIPSDEQAWDMTAIEIAGVLKNICSRRDEDRNGNRYNRLGNCDFEQVLRERCKKDRRFAMSVLDRLTPGEQDLAAAFIVGSIPLPDEENTGTEFTVAQYISIIENLVFREFTGQRFHNVVGRITHRLASREIGVPTPIIACLKRWLLSDPVVDGTDEGESAKENFIERAWQTNGVAVPAIWGIRHGEIVPDNFYWMGEALKLVQYNKPAEANSVCWAKAMDACIERGFPDRLWRSWLFAAYAYVPDRAEFAPVLERLFAVRPTLNSTPEGFLAIKKFSRWFGADTREILLQAMLASDLASPKQAAGELAALFWLRDQDEAARNVIQAQMQKSSDLDNEPFFAGVVHTASYLFHKEEYRGDATALLISACSSRSPRVVRAFYMAFRHDDALADDHYTKQLLEAMDSEFHFDEFSHLHGLADGLWNITDSHPLLVLRICRKIVASEQRSQNQGQGYRLGLGEETLVKISTTLHRKESPIREEALSLFEDLQEIEARGVKTYLQELDGRVQ